MSTNWTERVPQDIRAQTRTAHAQEDDIGVGAAVGGELSKLGRVLEHLLGHVQPAEAVADLLALGRVQRPQRRVLGPEASGRLGLLALRYPPIHVVLMRAAAVSLPRALALIDVMSLLLYRGQ